ncbi:unnamed protein product [Staurois parvus]|uniref:Uncharacterized protein n=1 Tax=Staurois parvus TaxID=386267 RepID=A0ABN9GN02_9NEOB|nr:unnamed protein product [Staurois parvus]
MDCRHSTGDDQRLRTVQEMTRDCGHSTGDDQRLRTVQEMTVDLWGGGERVPEFDRYPLLLPELFFHLTCSSIQPCAVFPASVMALGMTAGCPVRMSEKRCAL